MSDILHEARNFLVASLRGKQLQRETVHPWRKEWEYTVCHSLRVENYVVEILKRGQYHFTETEKTLLRLAAILHDIGRLERKEDHAKFGAEIAGRWLSTNSQNKLSKEQTEKVVQLIAGHSEKGQVESDISHAVLKDADTLDEIGAISIFMSSNWIDRQSPYFLHNLLQRLQEFEIPFCEEKMAILNTQAAREILMEKEAFIAAFINQLSNELASDSQIERLLSKT